MFSRQMTLVAAGDGAHRRQGKFSCPGARFSEVPVTFRGPESCFVFPVFASDTIKLSFNKAELTGLWARNCATIRQVLMLKFAFGTNPNPT